MNTVMIILDDLKLKNDITVRAPARAATRKGENYACRSNTGMYARNNYGFQLVPRLRLICYCYISATQPCQLNGMH